MYFSIDLIFFWGIFSRRICIVLGSLSNAQIFMDISMESLKEL